MNRAILLIVAASLLAAGCGQGIYPVSGTVVWSDGAAAKELVDGHVVFELPAEDITARGIIQADGTFQLTTNEPNDGARVGQHRVFIMELRGPIKPDSPVAAPGIMDAKFSAAATSGLHADIKPGHNQIELKVERAAKR